jgi:hypothetical protein
MGRFWVWVFTDIEGLLWVFQHHRMAFPTKARLQAARISRGDRAVLYVSGAAFGDPVGAESRLIGLVTVTGTEQDRQPVRIGKRNYTWVVDFSREVVREDMSGPRIKTLIYNLQLVKQPENWGQYFRGSPIEITEMDFLLMEKAVKNWAARD